MPGLSDRAPHVGATATTRGTVHRNGIEPLKHRHAGTDRRCHD